MVINQSEDNQVTQLGIHQLPREENTILTTFTMNIFVPN